ncbi:hypothetical protein CVT25_007364 [Psilocybe cyanescens]|uniref:Uncharacterized protein n=1 Tax=Psilocybe cyanescens TaxID=93625 RepID=A0A409XJG5_PSICY|nr:hypothetical protein CVT25_007364 [Psilocybe cyanescens]
MPRTLLPQELVELIIDEVANKSDRAQCVAESTACSSVLWSFITPAWKHISKDVYLVEDAGGPERYARVGALSNEGITPTRPKQAKSSASVQVDLDVAMKDYKGKTS